jgi:hypothetical protein
MSETICVKIHGADFILEKQKIRDIADGSRNMWAVTDEMKKYSLIISLDETGKMIQLKPLICNLKEYKISYHDFLHNPLDFFQIPETAEQLSQSSYGKTNTTSQFVTVDNEQEHIFRPNPLFHISSRRFLSDRVRKTLTERFGDGKSDEQLQFLQQQEIDLVNKKIRLEQDLEIIDPAHSRSIDLLEDMIATKKHLRKVVGDEHIDSLSPSEFEDLYGFFHELQDSMKSDNWIQYKLKKIMKRRLELRSHKTFRDLDAFLLDQCSH